MKRIKFVYLLFIDIIRILQPMSFSHVKQRSPWVSSILSYSLSSSLLYYIFYFLEASTDEYG